MNILETVDLVQFEKLNLTVHQNIRWIGKLN